MLLVPGVKLPLLGRVFLVLCRHFWWIWRPRRQWGYCSDGRNEQQVLFSALIASVGLHYVIQKPPPRHALVTAGFFSLQESEPSGSVGAALQRVDLKGVKHSDSVGADLEHIHITRAGRCVHAGASK